MNVLKTTVAALSLVLVGGMAMAQSAPHPKTCVFYENFDYKGASFGLHAPDSLITNGNAPVLGNGKVFNASEWAGRVSSVRVPSGCRANFRNANGTGGYHPADRAQFNGDNNDNGVSFNCSC